MRGAIAAVHIPSMREARTLFPCRAARTDRRCDRTGSGGSIWPEVHRSPCSPEAGGESIGFADFGRCRDEDISPGTVGEMMAIYVHPRHAQGRGVGSALIREQQVGSGVTDSPTCRSG